MTFGLVHKSGEVYQFITRLMYTNKAIWRNQLTKCAVFTLRRDTQFYILTICCKQQQAPFLFVLSIKMSANLIAAKRKCCNIETPQTYKKNKSQINVRGSCPRFFSVWNSVHCSIDMESPIFHLLILILFSIHCHHQSYPKQMRPFHQILRNSPDPCGVEMLPFGFSTCLNPSSHVISVLPPAVLCVLSLFQKRNS